MGTVGFSRSPDLKTPLTFDFRPKDSLEIVPKSYRIALSVVCILIIVVAVEPQEPAQPPRHHRSVHLARLPRHNHPTARVRIEEIKSRFEVR